MRGAQGSQQRLWRVGCLLCSQAYMQHPPHITAPPGEARSSEEGVLRLVPFSVPRVRAPRTRAK